VTSVPLTLIFLGEYNIDFALAIQKMVDQKKFNGSKLNIKIEGWH
jgi:hypothetical protein